MFIFQTDSTLITGSSSTVSLINGALECNVFWQVGSSATLGSGSTFVGNILALTSVSVNDGVTVHGRALAQTGSVTLINDVFTSPTCAAAPVPATTTTTVAATTTVVAAATTAVAATTTPVAAHHDPFDGHDGRRRQHVAGNRCRHRRGLSAVAAASLAVGLVAVIIARRRPVVRR